ncbi:hypothetical protein GFO_0381 [Christiangramia forsetii KT0803]|uniref:Uncharacterized protein n=1 Tax=Christiangramia forsetii (strain DSM 17595 / CGMCC 1.15422 / KT0803) TaxID=411154 RepID=A0LYC1_CHRFK|nr:hypothetical protein GFO_0381 [Christiangramia forsetii KT0803]
MPPFFIYKFVLNKFRFSKIVAQRGSFSLVHKQLHTTQPGRPDGGDLCLTKRSG